jgi:hypothetical protein
MLRQSHFEVDVVLIQHIPVAFDRHRGMVSEPGLEAKFLKQHDDKGLFRWSWSLVVEVLEGSDGVGECRVFGESFD